ncbi:MAG: Ldh family oxidoreductase [Comamonas sp.]|jgi:LDH2 family malate/lactate/ureidoglycolate dehydrogenase|nr:Ldh family oxidoreductase [Comamonas sp.]
MDHAPEDSLLVSESDLQRLALQVLQHLGLSPDHAQAIARIVVAGQRDACQSHGAYRILSAAQTIRTGLVNLQARPLLQPTQGAITRVDAQRGFSPWALEVGLPPLVATTRQLGMGALVINHCFHFTALWPEVEMLTGQGLAALVMTPSHAWVAPAGGTKGVFGTNPIAFGWPRPGPYPYVFDFATSAIARGDLDLHRRAGIPLPEGVGIDAQGLPSTDPAAVAQGAMRTFGGHKGSALATMVELMAGMLIGDLGSQESMALDAGAGGMPCHGHLVLAFDPQRFAGEDWPAHQARAEAMFAAIKGQGARLPSERRYAARALSAQQGIRLPRKLHDEILALLD